MASPRLVISASGVPTGLLRSSSSPATCTSASSGGHDLYGDELTSTRGHVLGCHRRRTWLRERQPQGRRVRAWLASSWLIDHARQGTRRCHEQEPSPCSPSVLVPSRVRADTKERRASPHAFKIDEAVGACVRRARYRRCSDLDRNGWGTPSGLVMGVCVRLSVQPRGQVWCWPALDESVDASSCPSFGERNATAGRYEHPAQSSLLSRAIGTLSADRQGGGGERSDASSGRDVRFHGLAGSVSCISEVRPRLAR